MVKMRFEPVSIIVPTKNRGGIINSTVKALLNLDYPKYEIIVINDGSADDTEAILKDYSTKIRYNSNPVSKGPATARNIGVKLAKYHLLAFIDDDCIVDRNWLKSLVSNISKDMECVTSWYEYALTHSFCIPKKIFDAIGYFDETFPYAYREDTDFLFRLKDEGYKIKKISKPMFKEIKPTTKGISDILRYFIRRLSVHMSDVLLYKKHANRTKDYMKIKFNFLISPLEDFRRATGLWWRHRGLEFSISSPQGVVLIEGREPLSWFIIFGFGISYVILVKLVRLLGSIKYGKLLI